MQGRSKNHITKSSAIATQLRDDIVSGRIEPGSSLPKWDTMEELFSAGRPTLMKAMAQLKEDGYIKATRSKGTFVHDRPPHLTRFGLVFPSHPSIAYTGMGRWNNFWEMLSRFAPVIGNELNLDIPVYYNIGTGLGNDEERLEKDLSRQLVGGLIVVAHDILDHPLLRDTCIPIVLVSIRTQEIKHPQLYVDHSSFVRGVLEVLHQRERKRVAVFTDRYFAFSLEQEPFHREPVPKSGNLQSINASFYEMMRSHGFESKPYWHLMLTPSSARNVARLLFDRPREECPDAIVVADDNLTDEIIAGLIDAGVTATDDLIIVNHCNWPAQNYPMLPTIGVGFDIRDFIRCCLGTIIAIQRGDSVPKVQLLSAQKQPSEVRAVQEPSLVHELPAVP